MLCRKVVAVLSLCSLVLVKGMPQNTNNGQDAAGLPLIQFTNGGLRFNFAGYHAEAGLGGLLGGSRTGGGLHASAGTPWGAHAGAGLGGLLGGDNANAGGGLYARAGLGNGRPEAAAGLGGLLDGSGRSSSPVSGGLFAGATTGTHGAAAGTASSGPSGNDEQSEEDNRKNRGRKSGGKAGGNSASIQIIEKKPQKAKQDVSVFGRSAEVAKPTDPPANKEIRETQPSRPVSSASAGVFGDVSVNPSPQAQVTHTVEKVKVIGGAIEEAPPVPPLPNDGNEFVPDNRSHRPRVHPKWIVRKRFWGPRKQVSYDSSVETQAASGSDIQKRQMSDNAGNAPPRGNYAPPQPNGNGGFYDDIFNIPISTLNAVNQLLNNNSG